jgi:hypothetical protein
VSETSGIVTSGYGPRKIIFAARRLDGAFFSPVYRVI